MYFGFTCTCGAPDLEVDIEIDYAGCHGSTTGPYESSYPGEGAEWHLVAPVTCTDDEGVNGGQPVKGCGKVWDDAAIAERFEDEIQRAIAERDWYPYD